MKAGSAYTTIKQNGCIKLSFTVLSLRRRIKTNNAVKVDSHILGHFTARLKLSAQLECKN